MVELLFRRRIAQILVGLQLLQWGQADALVDAFDVVVMDFCEMVRVGSKLQRTVSEILWTASFTALF